MKKELNLSWKRFSELAGVGERAARDWLSKNTKMPYDVAILLSHKSNISLPPGCIEKSWNDHLKSIASKGGINNYKKYKVIGGDQSYRKLKWREWWNEIGINRLDKKKFSFLFKKEIKIPSKNAKLAEFVGIMMGDGGMAPYHASITLNSESDLLYSDFVAKLIWRLFGIQPKIYKEKNCKALNIVIQRKAFVEYGQTIGLKLGHKLHQGLDMPDWIIKNEKFSKACIRGLIDTDGCVFMHSYIVSDKKYSYPKISFTSRSPALIQSVWSVLKKLGFRARISKSGYDVRLESLRDVRNYFKIVGSHNEKHLRKYFKWNGRMRRMVSQRFAKP